MNIEERKRFEKLESQISKTREYVYGLGDKLDEVISLLKGDSFGNSAGLIGEVKDIKSRVKKLENLKNRATWMVLGATIPSGYGIWEFLKKILPPLAILLVIG